MRISVLVLLVCLAAGLGTGLAVAADETAAKQVAPEVQTASHPLCWIEFSSRDTAASAGFFSQVFGWKTEPFAGMEGYISFTPPAGLAGGLAPCAEDDPVSTTAYIYTPDLEEALQGVLAAGGAQQSAPEEIPDSDGGRIAMIMDPAGVIYGLSDMAMPSEYSPMPLGKALTENEQPVEGTIVHLELYGGDFKKASVFFNRLFGWTLRSIGDNYMEYDPGSGVCGVFQNHTPEAAALAYLWTEDMEAKVSAIKSAGGKLLAEVMNAKEAGVSMAYFQAPGGIVLGLISPLVQEEQ